MNTFEDSTVVEGNDCLLKSERVHEMFADKQNIMNSNESECGTNCNLKTLSSIQGHLDTFFYESGYCNPNNVYRKCFKSVYDCLIMQHIELGTD